MGYSWLNKLLILGAFFALLIACSDDEGSSISPSSPSVDFAESDSLAGFILVKALGNQLTVGTTSKSAKVSERPQMQIFFDYDFFIEKNELTCGEFKKLMSERDVVVACEKDSHPVANVTFYDAVLAANEKSKNLKKDTVYAYSSATFDSEGHCISMNGYKFLPNVEGFRLPTESEWLLVASQNWNPQLGWNLSNSDSKSHSVCSAKDSSVVCDMAGNVMEWVNDWMGYYKDTTVTNFVGAPDGGSLGERVLKGGSYVNAPEATTLYARGDVYTVTSSTRADYVGFRLAYGSIPNPSWMGKDGLAVESPVTILANTAEIQRKLGTSRVKLAFRNDATGNLSYVDYSEGSLSVVEIRDTMDVYHPEISPDGKNVAFSTKYEGVGGKSSLYVRNLNAKGDGLVKLNVESAAIPRWRITSDGDTMIVYVDDSGNNKDEAAFKSGSTWQVKFSEGKFGTPKKLFEGSYHGGVNSRGTLAVTGARLLRAHIGEKNELWYGGEQACNVSLSKDASDRTLFLDFAGKTGLSFVGSDYKTHGRLLIADSTGKLVQSVAAPKGFTFDHSEWVVGPLAVDSVQNDFAVATLTNVNGAHEKIGLIDLRDSSFVELVEGDELWHPCLWMSTSLYSDLNVKLDLDSAAMYFEQASDPLLSSKMNIFWATCDSLKVVAVGSSRASIGFVPERISYGRAFNFAAIPSDMDVSHYLISNYVLKHSPNLEVIVLGLDLDLWSDEAGKNLKKNMLAFPGYVYDINHGFWINGGRDEIVSISRKMIKDVNVLSLFYNTMGWVPADGDFSWTAGGANPKALVADSSWSNKPDTYEYALSQLEDIIYRAKNRNILVVGVVYPQSPYYATTGSFGRHGMRRSHAMKILERIEALQSSNSHFVLMDENKMGKHHYADSLAFDYDHLNYLGGMVLSSKIDSVIFANRNPD